MAKKRTSKKRVTKKTAAKKSTRKSTKAVGSKTNARSSKTSKKRAATRSTKKTKAVKESDRASNTGRAKQTTAKAGNRATANKKPSGNTTPAKKTNDAELPVRGSDNAAAPRRSSPADYGSSVIRIKSNAKPKRQNKAASLNHRNQTANATTQDPIQFPEESRKLPKSPLSAKELREFKALLQDKRAELCGDVQRLTAEAFHQDDEGGDRSTMPIHMADLGSDNWEQDFTLGLIDTERHLVNEIDAALARIDDKTYGICLATHEPISHARLRAKPWAKYCIEYARAREEGRA